MRGETWHAWLLRGLLWIAILTTAASVVQRFAGYRNLRVPWLPSADLLLQHAMVALLFVIVALIWKTRR